MIIRKSGRTGGYVEIQSPPERYRNIDLTSLLEFTGAANLERLQNYYQKCVESQLKGINVRDENWTKSIAVGSKSFVEEVCNLLGHKVKSRNIVKERDKFVLKEPDVSCNVVFDPKMGALRAGNTYFWDSN